MNPGRVVKTQVSWNGEWGLMDTDDLDVQLLGRDESLLEYSIIFPFGERWYFLYYVGT